VAKHGWSMHAVGHTKFPKIKFKRSENESVLAVKNWSGRIGVVFKALNLAEFIFGDVKHVN
jgi:hypothetical protein